jgi:DNA polymerase-1
LRLKPKPTLVFDAETDGLLREVTVIHCIVVKDIGTGQVRRFRKNNREDTIQQGLDYLNTAERIIGHNIVAYDIPVFELLYDWQCEPLIEDTLVHVRLRFPDQKERDYRLFEEGKLPGKLIGTHKLDAWGHRIGKFKGDYSKIKEDEGLAKGFMPGSEEMRAWVWGRWTTELEDYCEGDVEVTAELWEMIQKRETSPEALLVQHLLADMMARQEQSGFLFMKDRAEQLAEELNEAKVLLEEQLLVEFPGRYVPKKMMNVAPIGRCVTGGDFPDFGITEDDEDNIRWWGQPEQKKTNSPKYKDKPRWDEGAWFTPIKWQVFNPRSRPQITNRLQDMGWEPEEEDYTEKGNVKANDVILRRIALRFPVAIVLADLMATNKLLGQLADGKNAWLKLVDDDGYMRAYCNPCGAVTTRATHSYPNLAQIPAVRKKKATVSELWEVTGNERGIVLPNAIWKGQPVLITAYALEGTGVLDWCHLADDDKIEVIILGLKGGWGYECRSLFTVPDGWTMVGSDLAGIELRCLAHRMAAYDGGAYGRVLLEGDIHTFNQQMFELETRDQAKTTIYACVPMDTKALTRTGWKLYHELEVGEHILTYNAADKVKEWEPVLEKVLYEDAPVTEIRHNHSFSIRSTPNHRWFTRRRSASAKRGHYMVDAVCTTAALTTEHNIITNAPMRQENNGGIRPDIFDLLKYGTDWTKVVCEMTQPERLAFLTGFCLADGHQNNNTGAWGWVQNKGELFEAAFTASYLAHHGNLHVSKKVGCNYEMANVRLSKKGHVTCQKIQRIEHPRQQVWCVKTENESWVIRQGDVITITGNTLYGAGDEKIGKIVSPLSSPEKQRKIGKEKKAKFSKNVPAYGRVQRDIQKQAARQYLTGLDGRRLFVRSKHAALNTDLQGMGATIANWWLVFIMEFLEDEGFTYGWDGDFTFLVWCHDEIQIACRDGLEETVKSICMDAAAEAGRYLGFQLPVDASAVHGQSWAQTH